MPSFKAILVRNHVWQYNINDCSGKNKTGEQPKCAKSFDLPKNSRDSKFKESVNIALGCEYKEILSRCKHCMRCYRRTGYSFVVNHFT